MLATNAELQLAGDYVRDTDCHVFLTGKAGTGKTTFLQRLKAERPKRLVVTAPTGVAAINAGGVTLHSFFQLPFGPFIPGSEARRSQYRFSREKIDLLRNLDLLIIDEVSMVRADLLDGVDSVLRRHRLNDQPFGGVQLLLIGDLFQLPPVVTDAEWRLLRQSYASPYFFSSAALKRTEMVTIELQHIFRQVDGEFIALLNRVRNDRLDAASLGALNRRYQADFAAPEGERYITLCTHNRSADTLNHARLGELSSPVHRFEAEIEGDFPEATYPTAGSLELKTGAQVMFVRNDPSPDKRFFNGKIGTVTHIADGQVRIRCPEESTDIRVEPLIWENIAYTLDRETQEITPARIGTFSQLPLRLAWAITIHKSQGLTFDRAIIDAQAAFAHGQVYVALSRCRTLEGLVLSTPLSSRAITTDATVQQFHRAMAQSRPSTDHLQQARGAYQQRLLLACFDFERLRRRLRRLISLLLGSPGLVHVAGSEDLRDLQMRVEAEICTIGSRFCRQLGGLFGETVLPAQDDTVAERITKASAYFEEQLSSHLEKTIPAWRIDTDNRALQRKINFAHRRLLEELAVKLAAVRSCRQGFSPTAYLKAVSAALTTGGPEAAPPPAPVYTEADITHPELFERLKAWRSRKAEEEGLPHYRVLHQKTLTQIAVNLPDTLAALKRIKGIGERLAERYGDELVALVNAYRQAHGIETVALPDPQPATGKLEAGNADRIDTRQATLDLYEKGLSPAQIASERGLAPSTIEGHLVHLVETGRAAIDRLVPPEKRRGIEKALARSPGASLGELKRKLGADYTYGEIKLVSAHQKHLAAEADDDAAFP